MNKWLIPARSLNNSFISLQARHLRKLSSDAMGWGFVLNVVYVLRQTILFHLFLSCLCSLSCETSVLPHLGSICCFEWSFKHNFNIYLLSQFKNHFCFLSVALSLPRIPRILWSFLSCGNLRLVFFPKEGVPPAFIQSIVPGPESTPVTVPSNSCSSQPWPTTLPRRSRTRTPIKQIVPGSRLSGGRRLLFSCWSAGLQVIRGGRRLL
jgi:hypothetical protein